ncbi:MAG TPA: zf-HC2 domain-containing protein [bacterium]|nr:zf-HC2 domain-containing protein [bacterium]HPN34987.1 zf-HC2 domain-containing protein [bacterium]
MKQIHGYIQKRLLLYWDQELDAKQAERVARHLQQCAACRNYAGRLQAVYRRSTVEPPPLPPFLWTRINSRLEAPPAASWRQRLKPVAVLAVLLLCMFAGHYLADAPAADGPAATVSEEQMIYNALGLNITEPLSDWSLAGAVQTLYLEP